MGESEDTDSYCGWQGVFWGGFAPSPPTPLPRWGRGGLVVGCACDYGREHEPAYEEQEAAGGAGVFLGMKSLNPEAAIGDILFAQNVP